MNPTGLPFLLDFGYYKSLGIFTDAHQAALDIYIANLRREKATGSGVMTQILEKENRLNTLWGQYNYVIYIITGGMIERSFSGGTVVEEKRTLQIGDDIVALHANGTHEYREYSPGMLLSDLTHIVKYVTKPAGIIGGKEVAVESKKETIITLEKQRDRAVTEEKRKGYQDQVDAQTAGIVLL